jgi:hypothetical protein
MERAVPAMIFAAPSRLVALRSSILVEAISLTWAWVSFATLTVCGVGEPLATPAGLGDEREGTVFVDRDFHGDNVSALGFCGSVVRLAEFHDVDTVLAKRRTDRRSRVSGACLDLQLDEAGDLLLGSQCKVLLSISSWDTGAWLRLLAAMARRPAVPGLLSGQSGTNSVRVARSC